MKPGLNQGFVQFGTNAEKILRHLHLVGIDSQTGIGDDLGVSGWSISAVIKRLAVAGFIHPQGRESISVSGLKKPEMIWGLKPRRTPKRWEPLTIAERMRRTRAKRKANAGKLPAVRSVFELGSIHQERQAQ